MPLGMIDPIAQYDHDEGVAVVGGFVYRGKAVGQLNGHYVFGDFLRPPFNPAAPNCNGRLFLLQNKINRRDVRRVQDGEPVDGRMREFPGNVAAGLCLLGFGQDTDGEIYVLGNDTGLPSGNMGVVRKIVRARGRR